MLIARIMFRVSAFSVVRMSPPVITGLILATHGDREHARRGVLLLIHVLEHVFTHSIDCVTILVVVLLIAVH